MRRKRNVQHGPLQMLARTTGLWKVPEPSELFKQQNSAFSRVQSPVSHRASLPLASSEKASFVSPATATPIRSLMGTQNGARSHGCSPVHAAMFRKMSTKNAYPEPVPPQTVKSVSDFFRDKCIELGEGTNTTMDRKIRSSICWKLKT